MSRKEKLLLKLLTGNSDANFNLEDLVQILENLEFEERKGNGSHRIFSKVGIEGIINLQASKGNNAKPYQVKQVRNFLVDNKLASNE